MYVEMDACPSLTCKLDATQYFLHVGEISIIYFYAKKQYK